MDHWKLVKVSAEEKLRENSEGVSFVRKRRYAIEEINTDRIWIEKRSGGKTVILTADVVRYACDKLIQEKKLTKADLFDGSVARRVALIHLHPNVSFDEKSYEVFLSE